jgi:hypothetical protein
MNNKEAEIEEFRKRKILCTEDTLRRMKSDEELQKDAKYRERLYDWVKNGCQGLKPLKRRVKNVIQQREANIEPSVLIK